jgi:hypothetical protein
MNWKECRRKQPLFNLRYYLRICLEGLSKTTDTSGQSGWPTQIRTRHLRNTRQKRCHLNQFARLVTYLDGVRINSTASHKYRSTPNSIFKNSFSLYAVRQHIQFTPFSWIGKKVCTFAFMWTVDTLSIFCNSRVKTSIFPIVSDLWHTCSFFRTSVTPSDITPVTARYCRSVYVYCALWFHSQLDLKVTYNGMPHAGVHRSPNEKLWDDYELLWVCK